jgi:diguanylate cyclase (GGDEF)-like protein
VALLEELEHITATDTMTGVRSRYRITLDLALASATADRFGAWLGVCMVDIDHFKRVNDEHGHKSGDRVLAEVGKRLLAAAPPHARVGRYGGEEFLVILPHADSEEATGVAEALRQAVAAAPIAASDTAEVALTVSIGAAAGYGPFVHVDTLVEEADRAVYEAKDTGRDKVIFHEVRRASGMRPGSSPARYSPSRADRLDRAW